MRKFTGFTIVTCAVAAFVGCNSGSRRGVPSTGAITPASTAATNTQSNTSPTSTATTTTLPTGTTTTPATTTPATTPTTTTPTATTNPHLLYALNLINQQRLLRGLTPFTLDPALSACALRHSMNWDAAAANQIANAAMTAHQDFIKGDRCGALAENQGVGQGPIDPAFKKVFEDMMAEGAPNPGGCNHYGNLMNPAYTTIGIGIYEDNGNVWITEMFAP